MASEKVEDDVIFEKKIISHYDDVDAKAVNFLGEKKIKIEKPDGDSYT